MRAKADLPWAASVDGMERLRLPCPGHRKGGRRTQIFGAVLAALLLMGAPWTAAGQNSYRACMKYCVPEYGFDRCGLEDRKSDV